MLLPIHLNYHQLKVVPIFSYKLQYAPDLLEEENPQIDSTIAELSMWP